VTPTTRKGLGIAALSAAPFCVGAALFDPAGGGVDGPPLWPCPFRALTGAPCPLCGATRSVALAAHGDARFLDYNPWWVAVLIGGVVLGAGAAIMGRKTPAPAGRAATVVLVAVLAAGWVTALLNADTITAG
jgi:hypothetical protein